MRKYVVMCVVALAVVTASLFVGGKAYADSCNDGYAIMPCGASSPANFINKARANNPGDLQAIYTDYGLVPSEYSKFASEAKQGTLYDDGRIVVNGTVVGRSTQNVGRTHDSNFNQKVVVKGNTYWGGPFGSTYHANTADVMVLFNDKGVMQFAIISSCGNPQRFTPNKPVYSCDNLRKAPVSGKENTYSFTTKASAAQGAEVVKAVYDFGDGDSRTVSDLSQPVQHTFAKSSKIRVTVYVRVPGGSTVTAVSADCVTEVTVKATPPPPPPPTPNPQAVCTNLSAVLLDSEKRSYKFTATASVSGGAVLQSADFNFGDGVAMTGVLPNGLQVMINHDYAKAGNYTTTATLTFRNPDGTSVKAGCQTSLTPTDTVQYCKPGVPVGSPDCEQQLIKTGPGTVVLGVVGLTGTAGTVGHYLFRRRLLG